MERIGKYEIKEQLGEGSFGKTYLAFDTLADELVAVKVFKPTTHNLDLLRMEAKPLLFLSHRNIVRYKDCNYFKDENANDIFYIATEYADQGVLTQLIGRLTTNQALHYCVEILDGLSECHRNNVLHSDLKPDNIFLKDNTIKIGDFGLARITDKSLLGDVAGTPIYFAPEQFKEQKTSRRTDLWSVGVMLYEMIYGTRPFQTTKEIVDSQFLPRIDQVSGCSGLDSIIRKALSKDETERFQSCESFLEALYQLSPAPDESQILRSHLPEIDGELGTATSGILEASPSPFGTRGFVRRYLKGSKYFIGKKGTPTRPWPPLEDRISFRVPDSLIAKRYESKGGTSSRLGFPLWHQDRAWDNTLRKECTFFGHVQWFEGGRIYQLERFGANALLNETMLDKFMGYEDWMKKNGQAMTGGILGFPISEEHEVSSNFGEKGTVQRFVYGCLVRWSRGVFGVTQGFYDLYQSIGEWDGDLGFPIEDESGFTSEASGREGSLQRFENGCTQWTDQGQHIFGSIYSKWTEQEAQLGFALNSAFVVNGHRQQDFEGGRIIISNDGDAFVERSSIG